MAISFKDSMRKNEEKNIAVASLDLDESKAVYEDNASLPYSSKYVQYTEYADSKFSTIDENKNITMDPSQINLTQEDNSQYVPFKMFRRYDGIDGFEIYGKTNV